jgi:hypothetical protein
MHRIPHFSNVLIGYEISWTTTSFIILHVLATPFEPFKLLKDTWLFHSFSPVSLEEHCTSVTCITS